MHIHAPFIMYCLRLFVVVFQEINCLCSSGHRASSLSCLSVPRLVRYASEEGEEGEEEGELKWTISNLTPFLGISFFNQRYLLSTCTDSIC